MPVVLESAVLVFVGLWLIGGLVLAIAHAKEVRWCQDYLRAHQGEDPELDRRCWMTIREGQG